MIDLRLGDCLELMRELPDGSVDAVITDPPYGVNKAEWDGNIFPLLEDAAKEVARVLTPKGVCFWFCSTRYLPETIQATAALPYRWMFIWYPSNNMAHGDLGFQKFTPALVFSHGKAWRNMQDLKEIPIVISQDEKNTHPTIKPIRLMTYLVQNVAKEGQTVLDPFMGSGTTGVACAKLGRNFIGMEINPTYFEIAQRRIAEAQMQLALPLADGLRVP